LIYGVRPDLWGRGYATEAAGAVVAYALERLGHTTVKADVDEPNAASVRVLEKLGLKRVRSATAGGRTLLYFERGACGGRDVSDE
jgi:[ribosomal protein S5]-alanine N-acetyltransferase